MSNVEFLIILFPNSSVPSKLGPTCGISKNIFYCISITEKLADPRRRLDLSPLPNTHTFTYIHLFKRSNRIFLAIGCGFHGHLISYIMIVPDYSIIGQIAHLGGRPHSKWLTILSVETRKL